MGKRGAASPLKPRKKGRPRKDEEVDEDDAEVAAQMRRKIILEKNEDDDEIADYQEEGGFMLEDIYIPPKITRSEHPCTGQRLVIEKIVCENFKSYGGLKAMGPFHKSFSAIIGPNGNGKSNIIDAMLFVFGYRASKIRCKKLSTLIHKSELLPNLRSCAVTVHFVKIIDEGDKGKGDDYEIVEGSRITVMRRAYTDNASVYHLDGRKVKFQDVAKFLKTNGIDIVHNRFLILQGEVEQIAQMPPISPNGHDTGLLEFLEEVIGTKRYIKPLALLDQRVETYDYEREEKLQRVDLAEKEKASLAEPVRKAKEYLRDQNSKTKYLSMMLQKQAHNAKIKHQEKEKVMIEVEAKMGVLMTRLKEISQINQARKHEYQETEKQFKAAEKEYNKAKKAMDASDAQYIQLNQELIRTNETRKKLQQEASKLDAQIEKLKGLPESHKDDIEGLQKRKAELDEEIAKEEKHVKGDLDKLNLKVEAALKEKEVADKEFSKLKRQKDEKKSALDKLQKEFNNYKERETVELKKLADMEAELEKVKEAVQRKEKEGRTSMGHNKLVPLEDNLRKLQENIQQLGETENNKRTIYDQARGDYAQANESSEGNSQMDQVDRALLEAQADGMFPGLYGRLKNLATIPEKYNIAATMATGQLEYWITDDDNTAGQCIQFLREKKLPVQTFVCLTKLQSYARSLRDRFETPAQSHRVFDLLNISKAELAPAYYKAYRNTLVAENIDIATKVSFGGHRRHRVVTLQGEIVETTGSMVGGGKARLEGKLNSKRSQVTVTKQQLANLQKRCDETQKDFHKAQQDRQNAEIKARELNEQIQDFKRKLNNYNSDLAALKAQLPLKQANVEEQQRRAKEATISPQVLKEKEKIVKKASEDYEEFLEPCQEAEENATQISEKVQELQVHKKKEITKKLDKLVDVRKKVMDEMNRKIVELKNCETNRKKSETKLENTKKEIEKMESTMKKIAEQRKVIEEKGIDLTKQEKELLVIVEETKKAYEERKGHSSEFQKEENQLTKEKASLENKLSDARSEVKQWDNASRRSKEEAKMLVIKEIPDETIEPLKELTEEEINELNTADLERKVKKYSDKLKRDAPNLNILDEYKSKVENLYERINELEKITIQRDLFRETYCRLDQQRATEFMEGFALISSRLKEMFRMISMGGDAELEVVDILDLFGCGVQFSVRPARKTWKKISNLSGGEKTLASLSLVFALHHFKPSPFYVMDEIDAALDFKNVSIIANYIKDRTKFTQFIIISLRSNMFELADSLLGVYKVDNMSYSIHIGVKRLIQELKAKCEAGGRVYPLPDAQELANLAIVGSQGSSQGANSKDKENVPNVEESAKKPKGFPDINVSAISNVPDEDMEVLESGKEIRQSSTSGPSLESSREGSTVVEADANTTLSNNRKSSIVGPPAPELSAIADENQTEGGSDDMFQDMEVDGENDNSILNGSGLQGPLAASTPFIPRRSGGGFFGRPSQSGESDKDEAIASQETEVSQTVLETSTIAENLDESDSSFRTAEDSQNNSQSSDLDEIGPSP